MSRFDGVVLRDPSQHSAGQVRNLFQPRPLQQHDRLS